MVSLLPLLGLAGLVGLLAAWLASYLMVFPARMRNGWSVPWLRGPVAAGSTALAEYAEARLLSGLPEPSRLFESLGPDRYRREIFRSLRLQTALHVDDVMARRNARAWGGLSDYARQRVYAHVQRRLPFAVDNFIENIHRDLDVIIRPEHLLRAHFASEPEAPARLFQAAFAADLRASLPYAAVLGAAAGWVASLFLAGDGGLAWIMASAAWVGASWLPLRLLFPRRRLDVWPFSFQGFVYRRKPRYLRLLASSVAADALAWRTVSSEFLRGGQAERVRMIMRREVGGILDTAVFKATLQLLVGPEAVVEIKRSAQEKALDLLAAATISPALRESYRQEVERTLLHVAATDNDDDAYARLWAPVLTVSLQWLAPAIGIAGFLLGLALAAIFPALAG